MRRQPEWADWGWLAFHVVGGVAGHVWGWWVPYWVTFAFVEVVGIIWEVPMTWSVRGWLRRGGKVRQGVTLAWCFWFSATWGLYSPLPLWAAGLVMIPFYTWITRHFLDSLRRRKPDGPVEEDPV